MKQGRSLDKSYTQVKFGTTFRVFAIGLFHLINILMDDLGNLIYK